MPRSSEFRQSALGLVVALACSLGTGAARAEKAPALEEILRRMVQAEGQVTLAGEQQTVIIDASGKAQVIRERIILASPHQMRREPLTAQQSGGLTIADGETRLTYYPERKLLIKTHLPDSARRRAIKEQRLRLFDQNFACRLHSIGEVAGRKAYVVELQPVHFSEGGVHRVWVDTTTFARLREEQLNAAGKPVMTKGFVSVEFRPALGPELFRFAAPPGVRVKTDEAAGEVLTESQLARQASFRVVALPRLPGGFQFESGRLERHGNREVAWSRYLDGLNHLSLFETPSAPPSREGASAKSHQQRGALVWDAGGINFVVVASLPQAQLLAIQRLLTEQATKR